MIDANQKLWDTECAGKRDIPDTRTRPIGGRTQRSTCCRRMMWMLPRRYSATAAQSFLSWSYQAVGWSNDESPSATLAHKPMTYGWIDDMLEAALHHAAKVQSMHGDSSLEAHGALSLAQKADTDGLLEDYWEQARDDTEPLPSAREMLDEIK